MNKRPKRNLFAEALEQENVRLIASMLADREFTILEVELEPGTDNRGGMTADVDGSPVLVAFTAQKFAEDFVAAVGDELPVDENGSAAAFAVTGRSLFATLPDDFGLLLNPESNRTYVLLPELAQRVKQAVAAM